jgi:hypothetical protein
MGLRRSSRSLLRLAAIFAATSFSACKPSAPSEPQPAARPTVTPPAQRASAYRPLLEESVRRIAEAYARQRAEDDAAAPGTPADPRRLDVGGIASVDIVAVRFDSKWVVAAVERDRVTLGLAGAERIHQLREDEQRALNAVEMARVIGALLYFPYPVWDGALWSETGLTTGIIGRTTGATPMLTPKPQGGRDLTFSFFIPEGSSGAGDHLAHIRVTDSRMLIDMAPNPERR